MITLKVTTLAANLTGLVSILEFVAALTTCLYTAYLAYSFVKPQIFIIELIEPAKRIALCATMIFFVVATIAT